MATHVSLDPSPRTWPVTRHQPTHITPSVGSLWRSHNHVPENSACHTTSPNSHHTIGGITVEVTQSCTRELGLSHDINQLTSHHRWDHCGGHTIMYPRTRPVTRHQPADITPSVGSLWRSHSHVPENSACHTTSTS